MSSAPRIQVQGPDGVRPLALGRGPLLRSHDTPWCGLEVELHHMLPRVLNTTVGPPAREHGLLIVLDGSIRICGSDPREPSFTAEPGAVRQLSGRYPRRLTRIDGEALVAAVRVDDAWFYRLGLDGPPASFGLTSAAGNETMLGLARGMVHELRSGAQSGTLFAESLSTALLSYALRDTVAGGAAAPRGGLEPRQARRVRDYMHAQLAEDLSLCDLAALVHMSQRRFGEAFRITFGVSPHQYLLRERVRAVIARLGDHDCTLEMLAEETGFSSASHLSRVFRAVTGTTPRRFARKRS